MTQTQENQTGYEDKTVEELFEIALDCENRWQEVCRIPNVGYHLLKGVFNRKAFKAEFEAISNNYAKSLEELAKRAGIERLNGQSLGSLSMDIATHDNYKDMEQSRQLIINKRKMYEYSVVTIQYMYASNEQKKQIKANSRRAKALVRTLS